MEQKKRYIAPISVCIALAFLGYVLLNTHYIPLRYRLIAGVSVVIATLIVMILTKKPIFRYVLTVLILILSLVVISSQRFFNQVTEEKGFELIRYNVIALKDHEADQVIGYYHDSNESFEPVIDQLNTVYPDRELVEYKSIYEIVDALYQENIDIMVVNHNRLSEIILINDSFSDDIALIRGVDITVQKDTISKNVDIRQEPYIVYISGIDVYGDVLTRSRSDLNLLLVVNPQTHDILTVSIPRDTYLPLGCETGENDKLTHAGLYGIGCSVKTIESFMGIDINYYLRINFSGLVDVVDSLDGVNVYSNYSFVTDSGYEFVEGLNQVNGEAALAFARERDHVDRGDVDRGLHHQELVKALVLKATSPEELPNLPKVLRLLQNVIDTNFGDGNFSSIVATQMEHGNEWQFHSMYLKGAGDMQPTYSQDTRYKYYIYWPDWDSMQAIRDKITQIMAPVH